MNTIEFFKTEQFAKELANEFDEATIGNLVQFGKKVLSEANDIIVGNLFTEYNISPKQVDWDIQAVEHNIIELGKALALKGGFAYASIMGEMTKVYLN